MSGICKCEYYCREACQAISSGQFANYLPYKLKLQRLQITNNNLKNIIIHILEDYERLRFKYKILENNFEKKEKDKNLEIGKLKEEVTKKEKDKNSEIEKLKEEIIKKEKDKNSEIEKLKEEIIKKEKDKNSEIEKIKEEITKKEKDKNSEIEKLKEEIIKKEKDKNSEIEKIKEEINTLQSAIERIKKNKLDRDWTGTLTKKTSLQYHKNGIVKTKEITYYKDGKETHKETEHYDENHNLKK